MFGWLASNFLLGQFREDGFGRQILNVWNTNWSRIIKVAIVLLWRRESIDDMFVEW